MKGKVWLVGAGPGDRGLLTVKGKAVLEQAQAVLCDHLVGDGIRSWIPPQAEVIDAGKQAGMHTLPQEDINRLLLEKAQRGLRVVRLKGGDPFLFGRGGEELELLRQHGIPFEIVPGVSSAIAAPAYAGIPVTHRQTSSSLHIVTGHRQADPSPGLDFPTLATLCRQGTTIVFLMGMASLPEICRGLLAAGVPENLPAAIIQNGTTARQKTMVSTVSRLPEHAREQGFSTPAVWLVGDVCSYGERFSWVEALPLHRMRIWITRPKNRASSLSDPLERLGAQVLELPSIQTKAIFPNPPLEAAIHSLADTHWIAWTSPTGVDLFFDALLQAGRDGRALSHLRFGVIGPATRDTLSKRGFLADVIPSRFYAEDLGYAMAQAMQPGERLLLPRAKEGSPLLTQVLEQAGISFCEVPLYETLCPSSRPSALLPGDLAVFTSVSTVKGFVQLLQGEEFRHILAVCIGEQTAAEARRQGFPVQVAAKPTIESLIETIVAIAAGRKEGNDAGI